MREGSSYTISCRAAGYGSLTYYWERKDSERWINADSNNKTSYNTKNTGKYRCKVTNEAGSVVSPVTTVYGKGFNVISLKIISCTVAIYSYYRFSFMII